MSILIIDSEPGSEVRLKGFLASYGLESVEIVKNAKMARDFLSTMQEAKEKDEIRLIIINSVLDDADGYELCRELHGTEIGRKAYKILLVSSSENKLAITKARQSHASDFSVKPYESDEFIKHLSMFIYKKVVLLIEDDPVVQTLVAKILYKKQLEVIIEADGMDAYNMINTMAAPRLVLVDIGLPGMNGIKLVKHIKTKEDWSKTSILMLTGSTDADDVKGSLGAGAKDYIVKPFKVSDFSERIDKYFN